MRILLSVLVISITVNVAPARELARPTHGGIPTPRTNVTAAPTTPDAPSQGVITRVDLPTKTISITGRDLLISQPLVAIQDRRGNATGLIKVVDLRVGMAVRYRAQDGTGTLPRVVELWILGDSSASKSPLRTR